jgi:Glutathione S-transferase, C-terminal domain
VQALDKQFGDSPSLVAPDKADAIQQFLTEFSKASNIVTLAFAANPPTEEQEPLVKDIVEFLTGLEETAKKHGGPYLFGEFSLADITVAPFLPPLQRAEIPAVNLSNFPHICSAMQHLEARNAYQQTAVDDHSRALLINKFFGNAKEPTVSTYVQITAAASACLSHHVPHIHTSHFQIACTKVIHIPSNAATAAYHSKRMGRRM